MRKIEASRERGGSAELSGVRAVVTGGSRGIGRAVAAGLAARGAGVSLWARDRSRVTAAADALASTSEGRVLAQAVDVRRRDEVEAAMAEATRDLGPITLLVNNAGTAGPAGVDWEADPEAWWTCVETTLRGSFLCARAVLPGMIERGAGRIVELASVTGTRPFPLLGATSAAKAALIRHAENLAVATEATGVCVFALHPGTVATELLGSYRSHPRMDAYFGGLPDDAYTPPEVAGDAVARIATGALDAWSGCFLDATQDLDALAAKGVPPGDDVSRLRLTP